MKKLHVNPILIFIMFLSVSLKNVYSCPCPSECICKPTDMTDEDFTRMNYIIDCTNTTFNGNQLIYHAESWSINEDKIVPEDDDDDDSTKDYVISIDLSNSSSLKRFNNQTIRLTGFSFSLQSLSLTNQLNVFLIEPNSFNSALYQNLKILNLSACCQEIPNECPQLFRPLDKLQVLDLSGSDMYKKCLDTPGTISSTLSDLILRHNNYDRNTFSHSSLLFGGVQTITGKLDLQYSYFNMGTQSEGNCLFDLFNSIATLDLSYARFDTTSNNVEFYLTHLLKCKPKSNGTRHGEQLSGLYLRQLNLQYLPEWLNNYSFPQLIQLDLSFNNIYSIDLQTFTKLSTISLAYNPIDLDKIQFRSKPSYKSINLRSTTQIRSVSLQNQLEKLFQFSTSIDYSENNVNIVNNITKFSIDNDFADEISLNLSQTNMYSFDISEISKLDDLDRLDVSSNSLTELNLERQAKLSYLDCSNQYIKSLKLNPINSKLIELRCSNNSLKALENVILTNYDNLKLIDLSYNSIESIEKLLSNLTSRYLHTINLKSNLIKKLTTNLFHRNLINLYFIDLSSNKINMVEKYTFQSPNLQILDLTNNPLKFIETKFIFTSSLRLFYIINNTQQLIDRCAQSTINDNLLSTYITWLEQNGTYMKNTQSGKGQSIQFDKCLRRYTSRSKVKWVKVSSSYQLKHLSMYITMGAVTIGLILAVIYLYKQNKLNLFTNLKRYRPLDGHSLVENTDDFNRHEHEEDEVIMNLCEVPFNANNRL